ncbi:MAG: hypothetical protein JXR76_30330 [Deltaproteobacteria bacterium]|nr:hypothetical protein [Deltaproteobacteria bacterium]
MYKRYPKTDGMEWLVFVGANPAANRIFGVDHERFIEKTSDLNIYSQRTD